MKTKFFWILMLLLISSVGLLPGFAQTQAIGEQFTYTLKIRDGMLPPYGVFLIGGNGVIEPGEHVRLEILLKNEGETTVKNVKGSLSVKNNKVKIVDSTIKYGSIGPNKRPNPIDVFTFDVPSDLTSQVVTFTFTVTADGNGPWTVPIKLNIVNPEEIDIDRPQDLITEVAAAGTAIYFILNAKYPTLTGTLGEKVSYGSFTITLHIPEGTQPFIFPIETKAENVQAMAIKTGVKFVISIGLKEIPFASSLISVTNLFLKSLNMTNRNLTVKLRNWISDPEPPKVEKEYLVLLKNTTQSLGGIKITMKQEYNLGNSVNRDEVEKTQFWIFSNICNAPPSQPLEISDYPPFQLLPPEVQEYLLVEFAATETVKALLQLLTEMQEIPETTALLPNYPNPFNPETWIPYQLAKAADVTVTISAVDGIVVRTLSLGHQPMGIYQDKSRAAYWDGKNTQGEPVASGVYFYTLTAGDFTATRKMLIRK